MYYIQFYTFKTIIARSINKHFGNLRDQVKCKLTTYLQSFSISLKSCEGNGNNYYNNFLGGMGNMEAKNINFQEEVKKCKTRRMF